MTTAGAHWAQSLEQWAIPKPILESAEASPWGFPVARFAGRADRAIAERAGASYTRALAALPDQGSVLDVGAGAGAASLPLVPKCSHIIAVDNEAEMLAAFVERADALNVAHQEVLGSWPDVADSVGLADVVVVHHVVYNVADIHPFVLALTNHAQIAVVVEMPPKHPLTWMTPLWKQFHGIDRPTSPTIDDFLAVLKEAGITSPTVDRWTRDDAAASDGSESESLNERAATVTRRLCLPSDRVPDVAEALKLVDDGYHREVVTVTWDGVPMGQR